eukprot:scaffold100_cov323-Pavlova_lutheri.AAC.35
MGRHGQHLYKWMRGNPSGNTTCGGQTHRRYLWVGKTPGIPTNLSQTFRRTDGNHTWKKVGTEAHPMRSFASSSSSSNRTKVKDYYELLGVPRDASDSQIKRSYYALAKKYHPDTNKGDPEAEARFQEVQKAYETLRDKQKRSTYDQMGHEAYEHVEKGGGGNYDPSEGAGGGGPYGGFEGYGGFQGFGGFGGATAGGAMNLDDIFESFFGGAGFSARRRAPDLRMQLTISFMEAAKGTTKSIVIGGQAGMPDRKTVDISIPPGVDQGQQLRVAGEGIRAKGLEPGNLLVLLRVMPDPVFRREGANIHVNTTIDMVAAALGTEVKVPTLDGEVELKVPPGTQPDHRMIMRGKGIKSPQFGLLGDQVVHVKVSIPKKLTEKEKDLLRQFASART